jgi:hypothetical protein
MNLGVPRSEANTSILNPGGRWISSTDERAALEQKARKNNKMIVALIGFGCEEGLVNLFVKQSLRIFMTYSHLS